MDFPNYELTILLYFYIIIHFFFLLLARGLLYFFYFFGGRTSLFRTGSMPKLWWDYYIIILYMLGPNGRVLQAESAWLVSTGEP